MPVGQLLTPLTRYRNRAVEKGMPWAMDNGAFSRFDRAGFISLMNRERGNKSSCLFVTCPDVVGCHHRTLDLFGMWSPLVAPYPPAFVGQDGWDGTIPSAAHAVFIGGTDDFKGGEDAMRMARKAKRLGLWVHVGRVNTADRADRWSRIADSIDGTGISRYSHMRRKIGEPRLPFGESA